VAVNPEFLKEGAALADARAPDRIVVGADDASAAARVLVLYEAVTAPHVVVDATTAETIKYAANAFLAVKVGFSNEVANLCRELGVDWVDVARGVGMDARIGPQFLRAGAGFGGSCFPKDLRALKAVADGRGVPVPVLTAVLEANERQPLVVVDILTQALGALAGRRVALLGLAFKPDTDDVRDTRALAIHQALVAAGADVVVHDPMAAKNFLHLVPAANVAETWEKAIDGADAVVVQTEWDAYRRIDPAGFKGLMRRPLVVDGRRTFDPAALARAGVDYHAIGLGRPA
jgi:UDPglucose 6-dehydrogenase